MTVDGVEQPTWTPVAVPAGATLAIGAVSGPGLRATLAVARWDRWPSPTSAAARRSRSAGSAVTTVGRCAPATCSRVGGRRGGTPTPAGRWRPGMAPVLGDCVGARRARRAAQPRPSSSRRTGSTTCCAPTWEVHFNSARTGVRLIGPAPGWARHRRRRGRAAPVEHPRHRLRDRRRRPHRRHAGDPRPRRSEPRRLRVPGGRGRPPSGGSSASCAGRPRAARARGRAEQPASPTPAAPAWLDRATDAIEPVARPAWNAPVRPRRPARRRGARPDARPTDDPPGVTYRRAGDRFLLVEYGADDARPRAAPPRPRARPVGRRAPRRGRRRRHRRRPLAARPGRRRPARPSTRPSTRCAPPRTSSATSATAPFASRIVHLPLSWDDPATREAIERYMHGVRADAPWCPWNIEFIRRINGLDDVDDVRRIVFDASLPRARPRRRVPRRAGGDAARPRHRLVTTKYNPARTWTPENAVGIGGAYLCIYGMEGPGGYQFVGRTVQVWNRSPARPALHRAVAAADLRPAPLVPGRRPTSCWTCGPSRRGGRSRSTSRTTTFTPGRAPPVPGRPRRRDRRVPGRAAGRVRRGAGAVGATRASSTDERAKSER